MTLPRGAIDNAEEFENLVKHAKTEKVTIYAVWRMMDFHTHWTVRFDRVFLDDRTRYSCRFLKPVMSKHGSNATLSQETYHADLALSENEFNYHLFKNYFWAWAYHQRLKGEQK